MFDWLWGFSVRENSNKKYAMTCHVEGFKRELSCYFSAVMFLGPVHSGKPARVKNVTTTVSQSDCEWISPTNTDNSIV